MKYISPKQGTPETNPLEPLEIAVFLLNVHADTPLPDNFRSSAQRLLTPRDYSAPAPIIDNEAARIRDEFFKIEVDEMAKPQAFKFSCSELESIMAVGIDGEAYFRASDLARISRRSMGDLRAFIPPSKFVTLSPRGAGSASFEFVAWSAGCKLCIVNPDGQLLIAWVSQVILGELFGKADTELVSIPANMLHFMISKGLDFPAWKQAFLGCYPETVPVDEHANQQDFNISLDISKKFSLSNFGYYGTLTYIFLRECEASNGNAIEPDLPIFIRMRLNRDLQLEARMLHLFLEVETPFEVWMLKMREDLELVEGQDYVAKSVSDSSHGSSIAGAVGGIGEPLLMLQAVALIGTATPTDRGQLMKEYFSEAERLQTSSCD